MAPILRLVQVPSRSNFGRQVVIPYASPHYNPVAVNEFETITINVKDDTDSLIPFQFGRTQVKLHFRRVYKR